MAEIDQTEFGDIVPYTDEEAAEALAKVANHPMVLAMSKYLFPKKPITFLRDTLKNIKTIDEFQNIVMRKVVDWVLDNTCHNFSYDGVANLKEITGNCLLMSNHRDIILDPAITQYVLYNNGFPMTEICVGDNLLAAGKTAEYLLRANRMIKVIRGISARELYLSSQRLSKYIRQAITTGHKSVWLAQRQGRTKNGIDTTEQGLLKMLDMSGTGDWVNNFMELCIVPLSISYEYEPCDGRKAREILISRTQKYVKTKKEDLHSILIGIRQPKGNVHLNIGKPLTREEIEMASYCDKNDRYQFIRHVVDRRIIDGYRLWKTNYMGYDLMTGTQKYAGHYTPEDLVEFKAYTEKKLNKLESSLDRVELRKIFWGIYGNPVMEKEKLAIQRDEERHAAFETKTALAMLEKMHEKEENNQ